jgi:hypothetical protein
MLQEIDLARSRGFAIRAKPTGLPTPRKSPALGGTSYDLCLRQVENYFQNKTVYSLPTEFILLTTCTIHHSPFTNHQSPITNPHSPITNHHSPITIHQSPITNHQSPITNHQSPITNHQSPCNGLCNFYNTYTFYHIILASLHKARITSRIPGTAHACRG